jgi:hypothetical protein
LKFLEPPIVVPPTVTAPEMSNQGRKLMMNRAIAAIAATSCP